MDRTPDDLADTEHHQHKHRAYRAAKAYVDASLRDAGHDPATTRICEPGIYAATVRRVFHLHSVRKCATLPELSGRSMLICTRCQQEPAVAAGCATWDGDVCDTCSRIEDVG